MTTLQQRLLQLKGKLTIAKFSEATGIKRSALHTYLHGRDMPSKNIIKVCKAYMVTSDWLLGIKY